MSLDEELELRAQIEELRQALLRSQQATAKAKAKTDELVAAVYMAAKDAAVAHPPKPAPVAQDKRKKRPEVALIHATDWQLGKRTPSFDIDTCAKRISTFTDKVMQITDIQRQDHPVKDAVIMLGGDMVEGGGNIFPSQVHEIEAHLYEQIFATVEIAELMIRRLAGHFQNVKVVCEFGNHGRLGRYGDSTHGGDNADRIVYRILQDRTRHMNLDWQASYDWYQHFAIGNYRVLLVHGDEIRSFSGTPLFAIIKRVSAWAAGVVPQFDDCYMGHWHNPLSVTLGNGNRAFVTGSPESGNIYAQEHLAAQARPSQRLHFIDPDRGRVASEYVVWLD